MMCLVQWGLDLQEASKVIGTWEAMEAPAAPHVGPMGLGLQCQWS
jgi:hypothetical protein